MAEASRALVDVNIVLDVLADRGPFFDSAARLWRAVEQRQLECAMAAHGVTTLHYLLARQLGHVRAAAGIADVLRVFRVAPVDEAILRDALALGWRDFEDAVHMCAALSWGAKYVVSRDATGFRGGSLPVLSPEELLGLLGGDHMSDPI